VTGKWVPGKVVEKKMWTDQLYSLRVDAELEPFRAGQFGRLALEIDGQTVARSYSFVNAPHERPYEFYSIIVPEGPLSPRLQALSPGDPVFLAPKGAGFLTLADVPPGDDLWLLSTGTALGPFLSILKTDDAWQRFKKIVLVHAVRQAKELSYRDTIDAFKVHGGQFCYVPFVSREDTDFAIKGRVPGAIENGALEARAGAAITAEKSQVMICGNPDMVHDTRAILEARGLKLNKRKEPGQISVENYW
jgi:ferredoxin/flavodoxin---NADP+ reductase